MQARYKLELIEAKTEKINEKVEKLAKLRSRYGITGMSSNDDRVKSTSSTDKMTDLVADVIELEKQIHVMRCRLDMYKYCMKKMVFRLEKPMYSRILYEKYFQFKSYKEIARELNKEVQTIRNYTQEALTELEKILDVVEIE